MKLRGSSSARTQSPISRIGDTAAEPPTPETRTPRAPRRQRRRGVGADLAGKLQREFPPERVAGEGDGRQPVDSHQLGDPLLRVGGEPQIKQARREMLGPAAV